MGKTDCFKRNFFPATKNMCNKLSVNAERRLEFKDIKATPSQSKSRRIGYQPSKKSDFMNMNEAEQVVINQYKTPWWFILVT